VSCVSHQGIGYSLNSTSRRPTTSPAPSDWKEASLGGRMPIMAAMSGRLIDNAIQHVPGGVSGPGTMFMIMGISTCHMLMAENEVLVKRIAGVVEG